MGTSKDLLDGLDKIKMILTLLSAVQISNATYYGAICFYEFVLN